MNSRSLLLCLLLLALEPHLVQASDAFIESVAPIFRARCVVCHNPTKSRGGLDLTSNAGLKKGGEHGPVATPSEPAKSRLVEMVSGEKPRMPKQGAKLSDAEIGVLKQWIADGARWPDDIILADVSKNRAGPDWWALQPLKLPEVPKVTKTAWPRNEIDRFILAALERRGLAPAPPADRRTLLRRVAYDLTGLPPTPEEVDAFVRDDSPQAYEKVVDRLLASPRYGERWGRHWLDVAHYGDTHGYDKDKRRDNAWRYRDYVIRAFNQDRPYARFIKEQLAGDVLYPADADGVLATGFIAAGPWDFVGHVELREGTVDKEKTRVLDRDDMVSTTVGAFLSLTAHCARCHDHKFDPIPQRDYYRLQAVFAGVDRGDRPFVTGEAAALREDLLKKIKAFNEDQAALEAKAAKVSSSEIHQLDKDLAALKGKLAALPTLKESPTNGYHSGIEAKSDIEKWVQVDLGQSRPLESVILIPARPTDFPDTPGFGFPVRYRVAVSEDASFTRAEIIADQTQMDFPNPGDSPQRIAVSGKTARFVRVTATRLWRRTGDFVFALAELQVESGGKNVARGAAVTALDSIEGGRWSKKNLVDNFDSRHELPDSHDAKLTSVLERREALATSIARLQEKRKKEAEALLDPDTRTALTHNAAKLAELKRRLDAQSALQAVYAVVSHSPRPIWVLHRGDVEQRREPVVGGALSCLKELKADFPTATQEPEGRRRAALAEWIADADNPLTWRSIVNRVWHYHFGKGIVDTPNDFGYNGGRPSHPELLDWLAVTFRNQGGSLKKLHRQIVLSATYQQASTFDAAAAKIDADNRYLWRMNRTRLDSEEIRDAVLAVSGKLDLTMGGPGFELFRFKDDHSPVYDHGDIAKINDPATFRRTVYRFVVRSVPNPFIECFDGADPNVLTPVRSTTVTALQALALLNDPFILKQAEYLARRLEQKSSEPGRQITEAFKLALGRDPKDEELRAFVAYAAKHGLTGACRLLLNLNEFVFID